ncbi:MAG: DUF2085 domain-containing protein, partial [Firmicutes bacterium]|nr:DUF2085 domain-containing protein [Bacillota bacterium]
TALFFTYPKTVYCFLMLLPLIIDGTVQKATSYESTNIKRLITGILCGMGFIFLLIHFHNFNLYLAKELLTYMVGRTPPYI